jgi:small multidrug resistance pump
MAYLYLAIAIIAEVIATTALKASNEFTRLGPSVVVIIGYCIAFFLLSVVLRTIPVGIAYAIWSGLGIVIISVVAAIIYKQVLDIPALIGIGFILIGVIVINVFSQSGVH